MNTIHVAGSQIGKFFLNPLQVSGKVINIQHHAQHIIFLKPLRFLLTLFIPSFQRLSALLVILIHVRTQFRKHRIVPV